MQAALWTAPHRFTKENQQKKEAIMTDSSDGLPSYFRRTGGSV